MAWVALLAMALWVLLVLLRLLCRHLWARRVQVGVVAWTAAQGPCLCLWLQCRLFWARRVRMQVLPQLLCRRLWARSVPVGRLLVAWMAAWGRCLRSALSMSLFGGIRNGMAPWWGPCRRKRCSVCIVRVVVLGCGCTVLLGTVLQSMLSTATVNCSGAR
jgi:hypothetical protein